MRLLTWKNTCWILVFWLRLYIFNCFHDMKNGIIHELKGSSVIPMHPYTVKNMKVCSNDFSRVQLTMLLNSTFCIVKGNSDFQGKIGRCNGLSSLKTFITQFPFWKVFQSVLNENCSENFGEFLENICSRVLFDKAVSMLGFTGLQQICTKDFPKFPEKLLLKTYLNCHFYMFYTFKLIRLEKLWIPLSS